VRTEEGKLRLFVAIDRTSKFAFARLVESAGKMEAAQVLRELVAAVPYKIHTVLTDNGIQFTTRERDIYGGWHIFDRVCDEHGIEHRLTKVTPPLDQRAGRADEPHAQGRDRQATPLRHPRRPAHDDLRPHLQLLEAYNHARRLKALRGLTPYESIFRACTKEPERFRLNQSHHTPGPNT
jgi:hypothetical protein